MARRVGAGGLRESPSAAREAMRMLRDVLVRELAIALAAGLVILLVVVIWPRVALALSPAKPLVQALDSSVVYASPGVGLTASARDEMASIIGTRPLVTVLLTEGDMTEMGLPTKALDVCSTVVDYHPDVIAQVVVDGEFAAGCEGDGVALGPGVDWFRWDVRFWLQHGRATALVHGETGDLARQLALGYDAEVLGDRLLPSEREFSAPEGDVALAIGMVAGAAVGAAGLFLLLRRLISRGFDAADRRRGWEYERDEIDGQLGDIALMMIGADPRIGPPPAVVDVAAELAPEYSTALAELADVRLGDDLTGLADRVADVRRRLSEAGAGNPGGAS